MSMGRLVRLRGLREDSMVYCVIMEWTQSDRGSRYRRATERIAGRRGNTRSYQMRIERRRRRKDAMAMWRRMG